MSSKKKQTDKVLAMVGKSKAVTRPTNASTQQRPTNTPRARIKWADTDNLVTVGAKVPLEVSVHWTIEAKKQRTSVSYVIAQALIQAFGVPDGAVAEDA